MHKKEFKILHHGRISDCFYYKPDNLVGGGQFSIYTTCIETIYGITFMVLAPDGKITASLLDRVENRA